MKKIAIVGATGLIGEPIAEATLQLGHQCRVVTRGRSTSNGAALDRLQQDGANIYGGAPDDVAWMTEVLTGCDVVICAMGEGAIYGQVENVILQAALDAGVRRFIPNEFGLDSLRLPTGTGALFDEKKQFQATLKARGMPFTIIFNGGIFDFFLPNLTSYEAITTFGDDLDVPYFTHSRSDLAMVTVMAALEPRCENQYLHLTENHVTQQRVLSILARNYPDQVFPKAHMTQEEICDGTHEIKKAIWIDGHGGEIDSRCLRASDLFPAHRFETVEHALGNPEFVFGRTPRG